MPVNVADVIKLVKIIGIFLLNFDKKINYFLSVTYIVPEVLLIFK